MIPESKRGAVHRALRQAFGHASLDDISLLTGGLSPAHVFKIVVQNKPYVLRVIMRSDPFTDPARQFVCMNIAARAGVAPPVFCSNAEDGVSIIGFIDAKSPVGIPLLPHLVKMIRGIHALPLFPRLGSTLDGVDRFIKQFKATALLPESATAEHFEHYAEIHRTYPRQHADFVSSHNDLNPNNILFDGERLWAVDWEAAFANDLYVDLAIVANSFVSTDEAETAFLSLYFDGEPDDYQRARFFLMRQVCHVCYAMVFLRLAAAAKPQGTVADTDMSAPGLSEFYRLFQAGQVSLSLYDGQLLYGKVLLNESLRMMKTARFTESIARMRQP